MRSLRWLLFVLPLAACGTQAAAAPEAVRDLGIVHTFTPPIEGVYCSGQPTPEQFAQLPSVGIRRVVTLRAADEKATGWEEAKAAELGIDFVRLPVDSKVDITADKAREFAAAVAGDTPVLVCCGSSNRVGALFALKAHFVDGRSAGEALELGRQCGLLMLEPKVKAILDP